MNMQTWMLYVVSHSSFGNIQERLSVPLRVLLRVANAAAAEQGDEASPKLRAMVVVVGMPGEPKRL